MPAAEADAIEAYEWIAKQAPAAARRWHARLFARIGTLATFPLGFPVAAESRTLGREVRQLSHGDYRVLYTVDGDVVRILRVRHGARRRLGEEE